MQFLELKKPIRILLNKMNNNRHQFGGIELIKDTLSEVKVSWPTLTA